MNLDDFRFPILRMRGISVFLRLELYILLLHITLGHSGKENCDIALEFRQILRNNYDNKAGVITNLNVISTP